MTALAISYLVLFVLLVGVLIAGRGTVKGPQGGFGLFTLVITGVALAVGTLL